MPRREAKRRREGGGFSWGVSSLGANPGCQVGWKLRIEPPSCNYSSFSVPRFPYQVCLRSSPLHPSLSAWKWCSATSGSCSILPGLGSWPPPSCCAGPKAKWGLFSYGARQVSADDLIPQLQGHHSPGISATMELCRHNLCLSWGLEDLV